MTRLLVICATLVLAATPARASQNEDSARQTEGTLSAEDGAKPAPPATRSPDSRRIAVPREPRPRVAGQEETQDQPSSDSGRNATAHTASDAGAQRGERPRGDNPVVGRAVPRQPAAPPIRSTPNRVRNIYVAPPVFNYYYSPRRYYPYGYGAFGLGYFYYDPYTWYPQRYYGGAYYDPYGYGAYAVGELRLAVSPRAGDVYVDGYFAGRVDDYDGIFQALKLEPGAHHVQIVAPGYAPLDFDVRINPGQKITYRGEMRRGTP